jgi:uncharacterized protein
MTMKLPSAPLVALFATAALTLSHAAEPLRVFIRAGQANRGQEVHAHPRFLGDWTKLLTERGLKVEGGMELPTAEQLARTDVLVMYAQEGGGFPAGPLRDGLDAFLKRGGGLVVLHTAAVPPKSIADGPEHWKSVIGGSWVHGTTKWLEGHMHLYYVDRTHPITTGVANFDVDDEIYYDMDLDPSVQILAASYTPNLTGARKNDERGHPGKGVVTVYDIAPQMWTYEKTLPGGKPYRAFVSIPGHKFSTFELPHYRAVLLRGIAWAGKRSNLDEFCTKEELNTLLYPKGGPSRPKDSIAQLQIHPDFTVTPVASEPLINNPMNIDWDAQGRLWVAETPEYPDGRWANDKSDLVQRVLPDARVNAEGRFERPAHDKISILTDTDGDGVMDRKQVFHEGLELVTSLVLHKDGCIVAQAPDILWLRDTDGDGRADKVEKLYTNLGTRDTHAVLNNLRWGFDGWIYGTHGYSSSQHVMRGDGKKDFGTIGSGVIRFKPDGSAIEQFSSKGGNTWGLQVSWDNEIFWTQPTSGDLLMHSVLSESQLSRGRVRGLTSFNVVSKSLEVFPPIPYEQLPYVQIDWVGRFTAAAGTVIYDGGAWPAAWNYNYFTTEPTINIVHHQVVKSDGISFTAHRQPGRENTEFIGGKDYWFRPIEVRVGPDGAVYLIDFYNQAVIHNDTRGPKHGPRNAAIRPDRDHYYGRIYRLDHKQAKPIAVPNLARADAAALVKALETPNRHTRMNAMRLLVEGGIMDAAPALKQLATSQKPAEARVAALWTLAHLGQIDGATLTAASGDAHAAIRKNAMKIAAAQPAAAGTRQAALKALNDADPSVRLEALNVLANGEVNNETAAALVAVYPKLGDNWSRSAFLAAASKSPATVLDAALAAGTVNNELVGELTSLLVNAQDAGEAAKLVIALAARPAALDNAKRAALDSLASGLRPNVVPAWSNDLQASLQKLLASPNAGVAAATLPLVVRWDKGGALADQVRRDIASLSAKLKDAATPDDFRGQIAESLLGVRQSGAEIVPAVASVLGSEASTALQLRVLGALGNLPDDAIGRAIVAVFPKLNGELQSAALNELLKRGPWSMALLDALDGGAINSELLGPANVHRLRLHPSAAVAKRANAIMDKLRGPAAKEKAEIIAKLLPEVSKPGNAENGKQIFTVACATCHQIGDLGTIVGPSLTGMGAHGPAELLGQIIDPNKEVDLAYVAVSIETKDGEIHDGILVRENNQLVTLKNAAGEKEIFKQDIGRRRNTGRSLMPEGFESLGAEALRDLLTYIRGDDTRFRFIDLSRAFTASTREGLYASKNPDGGSLPLAKTGVVTAFGVPFNVPDPAKHPLGRNIMVLKGGPGNAYSKRDLPQKAEVEVGFAAKQLHILGNVGGWAHPYGDGKMPVLKITAHYAGGGTEELVFNNGVEFADYIREVDVPGSKLARGIAGDGRQVRFLSRPLKGDGVIEKLTFESYDNLVAPTTLAITADQSAEPLRDSTQPAAAAPQEGKGKAKGKQAASTAPAAQGPMQWGAGTKVLLVGGGSAHDYHRFFNLADTELLKAAGFSVNYTESPVDTARELAKVDVAVLSVNRAEWATPEVRKALLEFVNQGKGLVLLHPGLWYNFKDWPEYNKELAGGGSRGHDKYGEFEVKVVNTAHPLTRGVPATFRISDELYYYNADPEGTPLEVLATAHSTQKNSTHPQVFVIKHPKTRIAGLTLGHDALSHSHPAYQQLLKNAVTWAAGK